MSQICLIILLNNELFNLSLDIFCLALESLEMKPTFNFTDGKMLFKSLLVTKCSVTASTFQTILPFYTHLKNK